MSQTTDTSRVSKKQREASRTCSEYSTNECTRCLARGLACVVPKPRGIDDPNDEKKSLRERVATLERLVENLSGEQTVVDQAPASTSVGQDAGVTQDSDDDLSELARRAPLVAALEATQVRNNKFLYGI
ncbi:hypothetical protein FOPE_10799 [Fonsecaea pedrosoi]|nr:hypothetical protein FOPE_10799 [Fonsecaea pedrosoi]